MKKQFVKILIFMVVCAFGIGTSAYAFTTGYSSFADLYASEEATDYAIKATDRGKATTILALHGGGIERGTSELVEALKGYGKYNTYVFEGLKATDNGSLFLRATDFDEPTATKLVKNSDYTVSVIGAAGDDEVTYIGGQNKLLAEIIRLHLITKGYRVKTLSVPDRIAGVMNSNIVNKNKLFNDDFKLGGVQIAISKGLRDKLVADSSTLNDYSGSINAALSKSWPVIVRQMKKITKSDGKSRGFLSMFKHSKPNLDKKVDKILAKGAKTPQELIEDTKE